MKREQARRILLDMVKGMDPITGEALPQEHLCSRQLVIRALLVALEALKEDHGVPEEIETPASGKRKNTKIEAPWTDEEREVLTELAEKGTELREICRKLHRRKRSVMKQMACLGLYEPKRTMEKSEKLKQVETPWKPEEDELLRIWFAEKRPIELMASRLPRSQYAIFCRMEKLGLYGEDFGYPAKEHLRVWSKDDLKLLEEMYMSGDSLADMADYFDCHEDNIVLRLRYLGIDDILNT